MKQDMDLLIQVTQVSMLRLQQTPTAKQLLFLSRIDVDSSFCKTNQD
jgi:hypothetical protein